MYTVTLDQIIEELKAIPAQFWITGKLTDYDNPYNHCLHGHCGSTGTFLSPKSKALMEISVKYKMDLVWINDGILLMQEKFGITGDNPKERVMNALYWLKEQEDGAAALEEANRIIKEAKPYVYEQSTELCEDGALV